ncbi:MAG TPA: histidinol phosphatase [Bacteroidetes bacterium]|nr:histidinol phosphatase [Bacteroidota bacterium]
MFQLFKKKSSRPIISDFSILGADMHSHLVPGIDDGSKSVEMSLDMIRGLMALGYQKIITTPHIRPDYFPNTTETIMTGFGELQKAVEKEKLDIELECAAEYFVDYEFREKIDNEDLLTFSGNHILIEISTFSPPPNLYESIFQLKIKGYQPIVAHPERYTYYQVDEFRKLKDFGCLLQVNTMSLTGHYGKPIKELAQKLLKADLVDLLGTDMHHPGHLEVLQKASKDGKIMNLIANKEFRNATL